MRSIDYQISVGTKKETYVDIDIVPSDTSFVYDITFHYKKDGDSDYNQDAVLSCQEAALVDVNYVSGLTGNATVRWLFSQNDLFKSDGLSIEIRPEPRLDTITDAEVSSVRVTSSLGGDGNLSISTVSLNRVVDKLDEVGGNISWNGSSILSLGSSPDHMTVGYFSGEARIFIVNSGTQDIQEYKSDGTVVQSQSGIYGGTPVQCDYNDISGDLVVLLSNGNFIIVQWKDPDNSLEIHASAGSIIFNYQTSMSGSLSSITSVTAGSGRYGVGVTTATQIASIDTDADTEQVYSSVSFETSREGATAANMSLDNTSYAFECGNGRMIAVREGGGELASTNLDSTHESFNRSVGDKARYDYHSGLANSTFVGVSPRKPLTFELLNHEEIKKSALIEADLNENASYLSYASHHRGDIYGDIPIRGIRQAHVKGAGMPVMVAMTGQTINCSIPPSPLKVGYYRVDGGIAPVYVSETVNVTIINLLSGLSQMTFGISAQEGQDFDISIPSATADSYSASLYLGFHYFFDVEFEVVERYYEDTSLTIEVLNQSSRTYHTSIVAMWWRQILKESWGQIDSILTSDIDIDNYSELPQQFFDSSTVLPNFYRSVGSDSIQPTDDQKSVVIFENALAVLTYSTGICIGDSSLSPLFSTDPKYYESERGDDSKSVFEMVGPEGSCDSPLYGLNADYQTTASFSDHPGTQLIATHQARDMSQIMYLDGDSFASSRLQNGLSLIPASMLVISAAVSYLNGNKQLNIDYGNGFSVDEISVYGNVLKTRGLSPGDESVIVDFSVTSGAPDEVQVGVSVNGQTPLAMSSSPYEFEVAPLVNGDHIEVYVKLSDVDNVEKFSSSTIVTDGDSLVVYGVSVRDNKRARVLHVDYSMYADHDYMPAVVEIEMTIDGNPISTSFVGDVDSVYPTHGKTVAVSYADMTDISLIASSVVTITATSPVHGAAVGNTTVSFYLRSPSFENRKFDTPAFLAVTPEITSFALKQDNGNVKDEYIIDDSAGNYIIPEVISSSGSPSSSSLSSSSSSNSSSSLSSSSYSSSSSSYSSSSYSSSSSTSASFSSSSSSSSSSSAPIEHFYMHVTTSGRNQWATIKPLAEAASFVPLDPPYIAEPILSYPYYQNADEYRTIYGYSKGNYSDNETRVEYSAHRVAGGLFDTISMDFSRFGPSVGGIDIATFYFIVSQSAPTVGADLLAWDVFYEWPSWDFANRVLLDFNINSCLAYVDSTQDFWISTIPKHHYDGDDPSIWPSWSEDIYASPYVAVCDIHTSLSL